MRVASNILFARLSRRRKLMPENSMRAGVDFGAGWYAEVLSFIVREIECGAAFIWFARVKFHVQWF
jgi:hypothetical protein